MLRIGSRGSKLALWQANWVKQQFEARGRLCSLEIIKTTGDKITSVPLAKVGTKGLFTKEIEEALLDSRIDLAVHSLKDLPTELPPGLKIAAIPEREDARDALVGRRLADLPRVEGRDKFAAPRRAASRGEAGPGDRIRARQLGHPLAEAFGGRVRRPGSGGCGLKAARLGGSDRGVFPG